MHPILKWAFSNPLATLIGQCLCLLLSGDNPSWSRALADPAGLLSVRCVFRSLAVGSIVIDGSFPQHLCDSKRPRDHYWPVAEYDKAAYAGPSLQDRGLL